MERLRKNDTVMVTKGRDRGKTGKILKILENTALVEKLHLVKRHQKPTAKLRQGGIIEKEAPIQLSNLMIYCSKCLKPVRIGRKLTKDGTKVRFCKKCREEIS